MYPQYTLTKLSEKALKKGRKIHMLILFYFNYFIHIPPPPPKFLVFCVRINEIAIQQRPNGMKCLLAMSLEGFKEWTEYTNLGFLSFLSTCSEHFLKTTLPGHQEISGFPFAWHWPARSLALPWVPARFAAGDKQSDRAGQIGTGQSP